MRGGETARKTGQEKERESLRRGDCEEGRLRGGETARETRQENERETG